MQDEWGRGKYSQDNNNRRPGPDDGALFFRGLLNGLGIMVIFWFVIWLTFCTPTPGANPDGASPSVPQTGVPK